MITATLLLIVCLAVLIRAYHFVFYRPKNFPPGPPRIPYFGSYLFMLLLNYHKIHRAGFWLSKYYKSPIVGLFVGPVPTIILNDHASVKASLFKREFDGKPDVLLARLRHPLYRVQGLFFTQNQLWFEQRRFTLRYLREFGFGRRFEMLEHEIAEELGHVVDWLKYGPKFPHEHVHYRTGGHAQLPLAFSPFFGNCLMQVWLNEKWPRAELHQFHEFAQQSLILQRTACQYGKMFSVVEALATFFPKQSEYQVCRDISMVIYQYIKEMVDTQIDTYDSGNERNFVDMYVTRMRAEEQEIKDGTKERTTFSYDQLIGACLDCFFPAVTTVPSTVSMLVQRIIVQPEIQTKMQEEIDRVVGQGRMPTLDDRVNLAYTEACIREIMRYETLLPNGQAHVCLEDTEFMGYDIPKGTLIFPALQGAHFDPLRWDAPDEFRPERFLGPSGAMWPQLDHGMPFSAGHRLCAGETFARNTIFLLVATLMQNFTITAPDDGYECVPESCDNTVAVIRTTPDYWVKFVPR